MATTKIRSSSIEDGQVANVDLSATIGVTGGQIADDAVTTAKILDNNVTLAKMAGLTRGSIILGDSSGDPSALALGASTRVLTSDGSDATWAAVAASVDNTPSFRASGGYTAAVSGTWYTMQLSSESWDTDDAFDTGTYRFTVPVGKGGKYVISYMVTANTGSAGQRVIGRVDKNGSDSDATMLNASPGASSQRQNAALTMILELDAGDYIELKGQQNRGVDYDFRSGETWMTGYKLIGIDDA